MLNPLIHYTFTKDIIIINIILNTYYMKPNHIIVDLYEVPSSVFQFLLSKENFLMFDCYVKDRLEEHGMTLVNGIIHHFPNPIGAVTALYLLAESHLAFHTFPENNYISMDCYTCGDCNTETLINDLIRILKPKFIQKHELERKTFYSL